MHNKIMNLTFHTIHGKIFGFSILLQSFQMVITDEEILMKLMVRNLSKLGLEDRAEKEVKIHSRKI